MKFSLVIPTYNRLDDLEKCLVSIMEQKEPPTEVLIIDDGELAGSFVNKWEVSFHHLGIKLVYYKKDHDVERRGLSESKNKSLELVNNDIFFIIDDDTVLDNDFCARIMDVWKDNQGDNALIGVGGVIINRRKRSLLENIFHFIFGLRGNYPWDVTRVGFQAWDEDLSEPSKGYYAHGGVCSYNLYKTKEIGFSVFSGGRTGLEDVDFCLRAKNRGYHFIINPKAGLYHYPSAVTREGAEKMGYKESVNRLAIFRSVNKKPSLYLKAWFCWSMFGWVLRQIIVGNVAKAKGMIRGIFSRNFFGN